MKRVILIFYIYIMVFINQGRAQDINVHISGNVIIPPCVINSGNDINIDFGTVKEDYSNASPYISRIILNLDCGYYTGAPYFGLRGATLKGAPREMLVLTGFGQNESILGVDFYQGPVISEEMRLNINGGDYKNKILKSSMFSMNRPSGFLMLTTVLYRLPDKKMIPGAYIGTTVMTFSYL